MPLRTVEVARATGYSVQQVRDLERLGVIPPATRSSNGYRRYAIAHVHALRGYRGLALACGAVEARSLLRELWTEPPADAAARINTVHARLARERDDVLLAQEALRAIRAEPGTSERERDGDGDVMTITELAEALQVRPSTLRFWEEEGLVRPDRVTRLQARRYGVEAIREARIVAAVRGAGYRIPAARDIMGMLRALEGVDDVGGILQQRLDQIGVRTIALLRAGADLAAVVMPRACC